MSALDAAAAVLEAANEPLHYREITERTLAAGMWTTAGKTPWDTVNARIAVDIQRRGSASRFVRVGPGRYALKARSTPGTEQDTSSGSPVPEHQASVGGVSFTDAAEQILSRSTEREPVHYAVITEQALEGGLIRTEGRTPAATMYSMILTEIRRREARGESPRFVQHGRGMVGLTAWLPAEVAGLVEEKNREVREALLDRARSASPEDFERLVSELLAEMGFQDVDVTNASGDGGIDVRGTLVVGDTVRICMAVQAKRWKANVQAPEVQRVRGSLGAHEQGLIVTTSDFSRGARDEATRDNAAPVALMNGEQLAALLARYQIGARTKPYELYALEEGDSEAH